MSSSREQPAIKDIAHKIYTYPEEEVYSLLDTTPEGLTQAEAQRRLQLYGPNVLETVRQTPLLPKFLANFTHLMALLLWAGGGIAFVARMPELGVAIWTINLINGAFSFWQEYRAEKAMDALRRMLPRTSRVVRGGIERQIPALELAPGDVLLLSEGNQVPADARLVKAVELRIDQSTLTGESHLIKKTSDALPEGASHMAATNLVYAGTTVSAGRGRAVVFSTAMKTEFGKLAYLTQTIQDEPSPLQRELSHVTKVITALAVGIGCAFYALARAFAGLASADGFLFALGMIVAFVPEGLLPTTTLALAMAVQRLAKRQVFVKRLSAVETLGCTSAICTDKTGTITQNEMTVCALCLPEGRLTVTGAGYSPAGHIVDEDGMERRPATGDLKELLLAAGLCNDARLLPPNADIPTWTVLGDTTEAALKVVAAKAGLDVIGEAARSPRVSEIPFDSHRRRMCTVHGSSQAGYTAYVKGAPSEVLSLCRGALLAGCEVPLDDKLRTAIAAANDDYARNGLRVLAIAKRSLPDLTGASSSRQVERDLTFLGLAAMTDPPRPEVAEAVAKCRRAGIRIVMITGDDAVTAGTIARRIGMSGDRPVTTFNGSDLDGMDNGALKNALRGDVIVARSVPEHKFRVVEALQALGCVVAVTGDGANDAPALKKADIGIAMGTGTDVAKESADMILSDDNFASIVAAVEEGRAVYANIKKVITYVCTSNAPEAIVFVLFALSRGRIPLALNVMQVLSIDLGTDMVPALALGAEPPEPGTMAQPPRRLADHLITPQLLSRAFLWLGIPQSLLAIAGFYLIYWVNGYSGHWLDLPATGALYRQACAMTLASVIATQIGNVFALRTEIVSAWSFGFFNNRLKWAGVACEILLLMAIIYVPFLRRVFGTAPFAPRMYWVLLAMAPALFVLDEFRKVLVRHHSPAQKTE